MVASSGTGGEECHGFYAFQEYTSSKQHNSLIFQIYYAARGLVLADFSISRHRRPVSGPCYRGILSALVRGEKETSMRHRNGPGDEANDLSLKAGGNAFFRDQLGPRRRVQGVPSLESILALARMPVSRMPEHPLAGRGPETRVRPGRGEGLPDWLAPGSTGFGVFPPARLNPDCLPGD